MDTKEVELLDFNLTLEGILASLDEDKMVKLYVLPSVQRRKDKEDENYIQELTLAWVDEGTVNFLKVRNELGRSDDFDPGQLICINKHKVGYTVKKSIGKAVLAAEFKGVEFTKGQSILITAPVAVGKTTTITELARRMVKNNVNARSKRATFSERMEDRLYGLDEVDETVDTNSAAPIEKQLRTLFIAVALALDDAHNGYDSVLAIDSMTRLVMDLTGLYNKSHLISGGIGLEVTKMVSNMLRMGGTYGEGTLTVIGTCLFAIGNNTWKSIQDDLAAAADGEIKLIKLTKGRRFEVSTRRPPEVNYPYVTVWGYKIHY